jgi:hypothetical protein
MPHRSPAVLVALVVATTVAATLSACSDDDDTGAGPTIVDSPVTTTTAATAASAPGSTSSASGATGASGAAGTTATSATGPAGRALPTLRQVPLTTGTSALDYDVTGSYPQLDGLPAPLGQTVNDALAAKVRGVVTAFEHDLSDFGEKPAPGDTRSFVEVAPTATLLDARRASLRLDVLTYVAGAAHPASLIVSGTYDLRSGRELALGDLFDPAQPYLSAIADRATAALAKQFASLGADSPFPEGVAPTPANYQAWWLTTDSLVIGFPAGQAGAYALGDQVVPIAWSDLRALVAPSGPVADLAR